MIRPTCFLHHSQGWEPPSPAEIREYLDAHGLSSAAAGHLMGLAGRDANVARQVRRWKSGERTIPYPRWRELTRETDPEGAARIEREWVTAQIEAIASEDFGADGY